MEFPIHQAVFSRDGRSLLLDCRDGNARLWDVHRDVEVDSGHGPRRAYPITAVAFDPNRSRVVRNQCLFESDSIIGLVDEVWRGVTPRLKNS